MSLDFLTPGGGPLAPAAESPMAAAAAAEGAVFDVRDGWRVAIRFSQPQAEELACERTVGWADVSYLPKTEIQGPAELIAGLAGGLTLGSGTLTGDAWWCPVTPTRVLVIGAVPSGLDPALHCVDVTTQFAALRLAGPAARETIARFCALDLRPAVSPPPAFRPGSVARTPGFVLCEAPDRYVLLVGAALGDYLWTTVTDAGGPLGGRPVGADAVAPLFGAPLEEASSHA